LLGDLVHRAFVDVDEQGAEAAAVTVSIMPGSALLPWRTKPIDFRVDRPFLFLLRDRPTETVLFMGRVVDPSA
jgi:serpin B